MGTQGPGRKRIPNKERLTAEDDALNVIAKEVSNTIIGYSSLGYSSFVVSTSRSSHSYMRSVVTINIKFLSGIMKNK